MTRSPRLDHRPPTLPRAACVDADWFPNGREAVRAREWAYVGWCADLPPGHIHRHSVAGRPVRVARQGVGVVAWHNLCRHRGAERCARDTAHGNRLACPCHAWPCALDDSRPLSTALATPTPDFDRRAHGLLPVAVRVWDDLNFPCLAATAPAVAPDIGTGALDHGPMDARAPGHIPTRDPDDNAPARRLAVCRRNPGPAGVQPVRRHRLRRHRPRSGRLGLRDEPAWRGIASPACAGGTLVPQDIDVARFHGWIRARMEAPR